MKSTIGCISMSLRSTDTPAKFGDVILIYRTDGEALAIRPDFIGSAKYVEAVVLATGNTHRSAESRAGEFGPGQWYGCIVIAQGASELSYSPHKTCARYRLRDEIELLEAPPNNGLGVQTQPTFQKRGIGATEVVIVVQVALKQLIRVEGGVFSIQPALHGVADHKGNAA